MTQTFRIGQIVPSSNTTMETEVPAMLQAHSTLRPQDRFTFHSSRMRMKKVQKEELAAMDAESDRCAVAGAALLCYAVTAFFSVACCITGVYLWLLLAINALMFVIEIIWLGNHLNGGAKYLAYVTQLPDVTCKIITVLGFGIYVFIGGYMAVVTTDAVQFIAILIGFLTIAFRAIPLAGGYQNVVDTFTFLFDKFSDCTVFTCRLQQLDLSLAYFKECSFYFLVCYFFDVVAF